ncbi:MAG: response regulator [Deltaproteobacteria bacterium]|nr:response regulator [Deltaproteobacteria bacterium]
MLVAGDVALTRFVAETLLGHPLSKQNPELTGNGWTISRAHSALEALVLLRSSGLRFDAIVLDQTLPDRDLLKTLEEMRTTSTASAVPIFVMSERGRDLAVRRLAAESFFVAGFIDKPVTAEALRRGLKDLERMRVILLVDADETRSAEHERALRRAGFAVDFARRAKDAQRKVAEARPDAVVSAVSLPDKSGIELCVSLKKNAATHEIPVVLHGQIEEIESQEIEENAHRADEFIEAPFGSESLVDHLSALVGRGVSRISAMAFNDVKTTPHDRSATEVRPPAFEVDRVPKPRAAPMERSGGSVSALTNEEPIDPTPPPVLEKRDHAPPTQRLSPPSVPALSETADQIQTLGPGNDTYDVAPDDDPGRTVELKKNQLKRMRGNTSSPPTSASPASSVPSHRAKGRRVPCHLSVSIQEGGTIYKSETLNISDGGILITTDHPLEIGTHIDLSLVLPSHEGPITAVGKVAWVSKAADGKSGVGVKFSRIDPSDLKQIVDYVNRVSRVVYVAP